MLVEGPTDYLASVEPDMLAYFRAREIFLLAPQDEKLSHLEHLAYRLHEHLKRAAAALASRGAQKSSTEMRWRASTGSKERVVNLALTFGVTGVAHQLTASWLLAALGHTLVENTVHMVRAWSLRKRVAPVVSALRASWYAAGTLARDSKQPR